MSLQSHAWHAAMYVECARGEYDQSRMEAAVPGWEAVQNYVRHCMGGVMNEEFVSLTLMFNHSIY